MRSPDTQSDASADADAGTGMGERGRGRRPATASRGTCAPRTPRNRRAFRIPRAPRVMAVAAVAAVTAIALACMAPAAAPADGGHALPRLAASVAQALPTDNQADFNGDGDQATPITDVDEEQVGKDGGDAVWRIPDEDANETADDFSDALDDYIDKNAAATGVPGMAFAVVTRDDTLYERTWGDCTSTHSPFTIGSLSKSFTALAIMQLVDEGSIDLDEPAVTYAPAYDVPASVTVRSLLNQTSGFGYFESLDQAAVGDTAGSFSYANANYDLLGRIVENVSGESYGDYLRDHVLAPLGMQDASAGGTASASGAAAQPGHRTYFGRVVADGYTHPISDAAWGSPASGYVHASLADMESYLRMYLSNGQNASGDEVISEEALAQMIFDRVPDPDGDTYYGMGWTTYYWDNGELVMSHAGEVENYVASMVVLPERGIAVIILGDASDYFGGDDAFFAFADNVLSTVIGGDTDPVTSDDRVTQHAEANLSFLGLASHALAALAASALIAIAARASVRRGRFVRLTSLVAGIAAASFVSQCLFISHLPKEVLAFSWRETIAFVPDAALTYIGCIVVLALCAVALVLAALLPAPRRHRGRADVSPAENDARDDGRGAMQGDARDDGRSATQDDGQKLANS